MGQSTSQKINSFSWLGWVWDNGPLFAFAFLWLIDFGVFNLLMAAEGHFGGARYSMVVINYGLLLPLIGAMVAMTLGRAEVPKQAWYKRGWWHWLCLIAPFLAVIAIEAADVSQGIFTLAHELSPSKLWHTIMFGIMGYWTFAPLPAVFAIFRPAWAVGLIITCLIGYGAAWATNQPVFWTSDRTPPHIEWDWQTLKPRPPSQPFE